MSSDSDSDSDSWRPPCPSVHPSTRQSIRQFDDGDERRTFMGIAFHNVSTGHEGADGSGSNNLVAALRQRASGILGTSVRFADLVSWLLCLLVRSSFLGWLFGLHWTVLLVLLFVRCSMFVVTCCLLYGGPEGVLTVCCFFHTQTIPFVAGGFMYIGAVAVLPTYVRLSPSPSQCHSLRPGCPSLVVSVQRSLLPRPRCPCG